MRSGDERPCIHRQCRIGGHQPDDLEVTTSATRITDADNGIGIKRTAVGLVKGYLSPIGHIATGRSVDDGHKRVRTGMIICHGYGIGAG